MCVCVGGGGEGGGGAAGGTPSRGHDMAMTGGLPNYM